MYSSNYKNAFTEVDSILKLLNQEDYNKIPKNVIEAIKQNQNKEYEFRINPDIEINNQDIMVETKAILYNLYRDYLASPEKRKEILESQRRERYIEEEKKRQKYSLDVFAKKRKKLI